MRPVQYVGVPSTASTAPSPGAFSVTVEESGLRVDELLARRLGIGRRAAIRLATSCRRNGRWARKGERVVAGDEIVARDPNDAPSPATADPGGEVPRVLRLTDEVAVLVKPSGLASVSLAGRFTASLAAWIEATLPECAGVGAAGESGLAHRLDTGTSGLLLAARSEHAYRHLRSQFDRHAIEKSYLAVVEPALHEPLRIDVEIGQHRRSRRKMHAVEPTAPRRSRYAPRAASTLVEPIELVGRASVVRATTRTGVRHQIRVHLAHAGHPLVGDELYGGRVAAGIDGYLLHAERLRWVDPLSGETNEDRLEEPAGWRALRAVLLADA